MLLMMNRVQRTIQAGWQLPSIRKAWYEFVFRDRRQEGHLQYKEWTAILWVWTIIGSVFARFFKTISFPLSRPLLFHDYHCVLNTTSHVESVLGKRISNFRLDRTSGEDLSTRHTWSGESARWISIRSHDIRQLEPANKTIFGTASEIPCNLI